MGEEDSDHTLPRVTIKKRQGAGSFGINFRLSNDISDDSDPIVRKMLRLVDDWTSYCITSLQFIPGMSEAGFFFVNHTLEEADIAFFSSLAIAKEERHDEAKEETTFSFIFHDDDLSEVAKRMETTSQMLRAAQTVQRSTLSSLIAEFDFFFSNFLALCAKKFPDRFYDLTEKIALSDLAKYSTMEQVIESRIEKTISRKLRGAHSDYIEWAFDLLELEKKGKSYTSSQHYKEFLEVCQRRHIMTHNGGVINDEYVQKCKTAGLKESEILEVGDAAQIDARYLKMATARVYLVGYYAAQLFLQNHYPNDSAACYANMLSTSHSFLESDQTKMAERIIDFAEFSTRKFDHGLRLKFGINRALAKLFDPSLERNQQTALAKTELEKYDWSVRDPIFELAIAAVKRDFENIKELASLAAQSGLTYSEAKIFVVFREVRELPGFMECFPRKALQLADKRESEMQDQKAC